MSTRAILQRLKTLYDTGGNIIEYLRKEAGGKQNTPEDIAISYEFQSGAYIRKFYEKEDVNRQYGKAIAAVIEKLGVPGGSVLEAGCGEALWLALLPEYLTEAPSESFGFDISWSRIKFAREFFTKMRGKDATLFVADLFHIPLPDNSVDIVYTSHSVESNGGREEEALQELYRVARRYVVLIEPAYEFADEEGKKRMQHFGYITRLHEAALGLGFDVV